jgi:hypothetical protein
MKKYRTNSERFPDALHPYPDQKDICLPKNIKIDKCPHYTGLNVLPSLPLNQDKICLLWRYESDEAQCSHCGYGMLISCILGYCDEKKLFAAVQFNSGCLTYDSTDFDAFLWYSDRLEDVIGQFPLNKSSRHDLNRQLNCVRAFNTELEKYLLVPRDLLNVCLSFLEF